MRKVANFCDYFVIATGNTDRQVRAIAEGIEEGLEKHGMKLRYKQGLNNASWAILDMGDVVTHIFTPEAREFYALEYLWRDASKIVWKAVKKIKTAHSRKK